MATFDEAMRIGPGPMCSYCGQVYGQHDAFCPEAERQAEARAELAKRSPEALLQRIQELEERVTELENKAMRYK